MKLNPLGDRVVLKRMEAEETTKGGIILTASAKERPEIFVVISVGPGGMVEGKEVEMVVKPNDKVISAGYMRAGVTIDGEELYIVRQSEIAAVVED